MNDKKTVKVRIAVVVDQNGQWNSAGWNSATEKDMVSCSIENIGFGESRFWLTAELPVPRTETISAAVELSE